MFLRFHAIETENWLSQKFWKKWNCSATCRAIFTKSQWASIYVRVQLNIKFREILCNSSRATLATIFLSHTRTDRHFSENGQNAFRTSQNV